MQRRIVRETAAEERVYLTAYNAFNRVIGEAITVLPACVSGAWFVEFDRLAVAVADGVDDALRYRRVR